MREKFLGKIILLFFLVACFLIKPSTSNATSQWQNVGTQGFSEGAAEKISLAFNPVTKEPYVAFSDDSNSDKITVKKYNGSSWTNVGTAGLSNDAISTASITFNDEGTPYIAFGDGAFPDQSKLRIMKFNGSSWENVGSVFNDTDISEAVIRIQPSTQDPYVAVNDFGYNLSPASFSVIKFDENSSSWIIVGNTGKAYASGISLAFHPSNNNPYITYIDTQSLQTQVAMKKFDGSSWVRVGENSISGYDVLYPSMAFNPGTNVPYVAYSNGANLSYKVTVRKLNGTTWTTVGSGDFSADNAMGISLAFSELTNEPYVTFNAPASDTSMSSVIAMKFDGTSWQYVGGTFVGENIETAIFAAPIQFKPGTNAAYVAFRDNDVSNKLSVKTFGPTTEGISGETCVGSTCNIYRFWSNSKQGHFFTISKAEANNVIAYDSSWAFEGEAYKSFNTQEANTSPIYRFWSNSKQHHFFTVSEAEKDFIIANDSSWSYEGIAYYAYATEQASSTPVYRFWSQQKQGHFFTISASEKDSIIANDHSWSYEGIAWYVPVE